MKHLLTLFALCIAMFVCASAAIGQKSDAPEAPNAIITSDSTCSFSSEDFPAFTSEDGVLNIPTHITKNGNTYTVTAINYVASDSYSCIADSVYDEYEDSCIADTAYYEYEDSCIADTAYYEYEDSCIADTAYYEYEDSCIADTAYDEYEEYDPRKNIKVVNIPNTVTTIGSSAFSWCEALTSINIPSSVTTIGNAAFYGCKALTSINIPSSVTTIGGSAFSDCKALTSINIPNTVTTIGNHAFSGCSALTSIDIPNSFTTIDEWDFYDCSALKSINAVNDNPAFCSVDGVLFTKDMKTLLTCPKGIKGHYSIPEGVTTIGEYAFLDCEALTSINIPNTVTTISYCAFLGCSSLTSINIPSSVTSIDICTLGISAFKNINVASDNPVYCSVDDVLFSKDMKTLLLCHDSKKGHYNIPEGVTAIGEDAFFGSVGLGGCDCHYWVNLTSINIPCSLTSIDISTFDEWSSSLTSINVANNNPAYSSNDGVLYTKDKKALILYPAGKKGRCIIPEGVTTVGKGAFRYSDNITTFNCYAKTPPVCEESEYYDGPCFCNDWIIHVPKGCAEAYRAARYWKRCTIVDDL